MLRWLAAEEEGHASLRVHQAPLVGYSMPMQFASSDPVCVLPLCVACRGGEEGETSALLQMEQGGS